MHATPDPLQLADLFDAQQRVLGDLAYQLLGLLSRAFHAMYPDAAYVAVVTDSSEDDHYFLYALSADGRVVHDFVDDDGGQLPELPADVRAEFGRYDPRDVREVQLLLNDACDAGAQLPYLPDHLVEHAEGALCGLTLDPA